MWISVGFSCSHVLLGCFSLQPGSVFLLYKPVCQAAPHHMRSGHRIFLAGAPTTTEALSRFLSTKLICPFDYFSCEFQHQIGVREAGKREDRNAAPLCYGKNKIENSKCVKP